MEEDGGMFEHLKAIFIIFLLSKMGAVENYFSC
jgi:hypothetical protein